MPTMLFSGLYKSGKSPLAKLRQAHQQQISLAPLEPNYDVDLVSKDKVRQKEAVKRYLAEKIRNDWEFTWPPSLPDEEDVAGDDAKSAPGDVEPGSSTEVPPVMEVSVGSLDITPAPLPANEDVGRDSGAEPDSETESVYSTVSDDPQHWRPRLEWESEISDEDDELPTPASPFRFDSPDSIGAAVKASVVAGKARRRREERAEMAWNEGLACFNARRDAWTGARAVRVKPKQPPPTSPTSKRRSLWRFNSHGKQDQSAPAPPAQDGGTLATAATTATPISPVTSNSRHSQQSVRDNTTTPITSDGDDSRPSKEAQQPRTPLYPVETLLPVPPPLLPPENPMRASISPNIYVSLYDKVIIHSLQPSCPINLGDMIRSCVSGWRRDGEWPPRSAEVPSAALVAVRKKKKDDRREAARPTMNAPGVTTTITGAGGPASGRRLSLVGLLGRASGDKSAAAAEDRDKARRKSGDGATDQEAGTTKNFRRSIQRVLGLGHGQSSSAGSAASMGAGVGDAKDKAGAATAAVV